jgi:Ni,Fe-hydrogenase maturation factor
VGLAAHGFVPTEVFALVAQLGGTATARVRIVGCEPAVIPAEGDVYVGLSEPVTAAVERAVALVEELVG